MILANVTKNMKLDAFITEFGERINLLKLGKIIVMPFVIDLQRNIN